MNNFDNYVNECVLQFRQHNRLNLSTGGCFEGWTDTDILLHVLENIKDQTKHMIRQIDN